MTKMRKPSGTTSVVGIWLDSNIEAHDFIPASYWLDNCSRVKELLPKSELYVYDSEDVIHGFIGMNHEYVEGIFVASKMRSQGIGKSLLDYVKDRKRQLCLHVYQKNLRALHFYRREGFVIQCEHLDNDTGEKEYMMIWK